MLLSVAAMCCYVLCYEYVVVLCYRLLCVLCCPGVLYRVGDGVLLCYVILFCCAAVLLCCYVSVSVSAPFPCLLLLCHAVVLLLCCYGVTLWCYVAGVLLY